MQPHYRYFFILLKVYDDYKNEFEPLSEGMDSNFARYALDKYGIEILFESNGHIRPAYNIKDYKKHTLFMLKYSDLIGDLQ
jgi:hypothetical protein